MFDIISTAVGIGGTILGGLGARSEAKAEQRQAEKNAYIGRTRAIQTDTVARQNLASDLGSARAVFGANQQGMNVSVLEVLGDIRRQSERERRISVAGEMSRAADFRTAASNAGTRGRYALLGAGARAAPDLYDLYQMF